MPAAGIFHKVKESLPLELENVNPNLLCQSLREPSKTPALLGPNTIHMSPGKLKLLCHRQEESVLVLLVR